jgi:hypothetical protein
MQYKRFIVSNMREFLTRIAGPNLADGWQYAQKEEKNCLLMEWCSWAVGIAPKFTLASDELKALL